jgi:hypothetical protein
MKKLNLLFAFCILLLNFAQAQTPPNAFNYSAVARNSAGQPIASAKIGIQISILKTSSTGAVQYSENHIVNTDAFGLFNLAIGTGSVQSGSMSTIAWGTDNYYIKVGMDIAGSTNFLTMGTTQLMSVPYALHSKTAESIVGGGTNTVGKTYIELFGDITNAQADSTLKADFGPNTQFVYITNTTKLTSIDLTAIKALMELSITGNEVLTTVNASSLTRCTKNFEIITNPMLATIQIGNVNYLGNVNVNNNSKLTSLNFPSLKKAVNIYVSNNPILSSFSAVMLAIANDLNIDNSGLTNLSLPKLTTLNGIFSISNNSSLTLLTAPLLTSTNSINIDKNGITVLSLPALKTINGQLAVLNNPTLSTLSFISLTNIKTSILFSNNSILNTLNISALSKIPDFYGSFNKLSNITWAPQITSWSSINLSYNALTSSEINKILALLVAAGQSAYSGTNSNANLMLYQTPSAPPTGQGITDKATIVGWGITVATN